MYKIFFENRFVCLTEQKMKHPESRPVVLYKGNNKTVLSEIIRTLAGVFPFDIYIESADVEVLRKKFFSYFKKVSAAGGLVYNSRGELLVIRRRGRWDLPKGHVDKGETKKEAALREVTEECGIKGLELDEKLGKTYHTYYIEGCRVLKTTHWYRMYYSGKQTPVPQTEEDIEEVRWILPEQVQDILHNTHKSLISLFEQMGEIHQRTDV